VSVTYVDTSAMVRAYLRDEPDHAAWRAYLLGSAATLLSSSVLRLELAAAVSAARRARRLRRISKVLDLLAAHCSSDGPISLLGVTGHHLDTARDLVEQHPLRSMDALHLATALSAQATLGAVRFVTCDARQAAVGKQVGLTVQTTPST
jgi:uncharacterized protein